MKQPYHRKPYITCLIIQEKNSCGHFWESPHHPNIFLEEKSFYRHISCFVSYLCSLRCTFEMLAKRLDLQKHIKIPIRLWKIYISTDKAYNFNRLSLFAFELAFFFLWIIYFSILLLLNEFSNDLVARSVLTCSEYWKALLIVPFQYIRIFLYSICAIIRITRDYQYTGKTKMRKLFL